MGIHGLTKLIADQAPDAIRKDEMKNFFGRKVAIDASMSIYQFLIAVRQQDGMQLSDESGSTTSHLMGIFYRTIRMIDNGLKPAYVFDGKPPELKRDELNKRLERRTEAEKERQLAQEAGDVENLDKFARRTVKVTAEHNQECQRLLGLMGVPYVVAPSEAEAQCAELARGGKVFAAGSEDMDTLTFGAPILLRHLTFSEARKMQINEMSLEKVLSGLGLSLAEFIDLCILLGCDYCPSIRGVGPTTALRLIRSHRSIERILESPEGKKLQLPLDWNYAGARALFASPNVTPSAEVDLRWTAPDTEGLVEFLVREKGFNEERVRSAAAKLTKKQQSATQGRLDSFFGAPVKSPSSVKKSAGGASVKAKGSRASGGSGARARWAARGRR